MEVSIIDNALRVINDLESLGIIGRYAIGGAIGLVYYTEPAVTYDLDIFCYIPRSGALYDLGPIFFKLRELGYQPEGEHVVIQDIPVQFLPPTTKLVEEALQQAVDITVEGVFTRIFQYEYLLAIMAETGRLKDKARIALALSSRDPRPEILEPLLQRYQLTEKWNKISS